MGARIVWNHRSCGRCGGTGNYFVSVGGAGEKRKCWGCNGAGYKMSAQTFAHMLAFRQWQETTKATEDASLAELASGRYGKAYKVVMPQEATS